MRFYNLGTSAKPCGILKWRGLTIMFDCSLNCSTVLNYLPLPLSGNSKFISAPSFQNFRTPLEKELCEINNYVLVDSTPLFGVPTEFSIEISEIDVILVSNSSSILALPFYTEHPDFKGIVYATEPTVNFGKIFMEELVDFVQRVPKPKPEKNEELNVHKLFELPLNFPLKPSSSTFSKALKEIYTKKDISSSLLKIKIIGFNENIDIFGKMSVTAVSSGYSLGSCNWILKSESKKLIYVTFTSTLTTHPSPVDQMPLKESDICILPILTQAPLQNPDAMMGEVCVSVVSTLRAGGNVIFPCYPSGIIYDLFECLTSHLDNNGYGNYPFYFIAPHAESSLAYSNILAEWLSNNKQKKVYLPEDPFVHNILVKEGRIKHFKTLHDITDLRQPCVVFCGHPSLRFGDIVHVIEAWGNNHANSIIFTEAEFPYLEALIPYQPLMMKVFYFPIDTSLNFGHANKFFKDIKPKLLVTHESYIVPPKNNPQRSDLIIDYPSIETFSYGAVHSMKLKRDFVPCSMDPKLASEVNPVEHNGVSACTLTVAVDNTDNKFRLIKPSLDLCDPWKCPPTKYNWGTLDSTMLVHKLVQAGFTQTRIQHTPNGFIISIPSENATITTESNSTNIVCNNSDGSLRVKLRSILISCLEEF